MKGKLGRVIFRRINGRMIPIRITNVADKIAEASEYGGKNAIRTLKAVLPSGESVGRMHLRVPKIGKSAEVIDVMVEKEFRRKGISKNLFKRATDFLSRAGKKFLRSHDIQNPAQVKIRSQSGVYKAGKKLKKNTKYIRDQVGPYGEQSKIIKSREAIEILKQNKTPNSQGIQIKGTTMIKRKK